jgi:hypothetical protein
MRFLYQHDKKHSHWPGEDIVNDASDELQPGHADIVGGSILLPMRGPLLISLPYLTTVGGSVVRGAVRFCAALSHSPILAPSEAPRRPAGGLSAPSARPLYTVQGGERTGEERWGNIDRYMTANATRTGSHSRRQQRY